MANAARWIILLCILGTRASLNRGFKSYPTVVKTFEHDTVVLPCHIEDLGVKTRVRWWREGILLADSDEPRLVPPERIKMWDNRSLEVSHVRPEDTGKYVCQVSRPAHWGHVTQVHEIEVMYPPSVTTVPESGELEVNLGEEVDMSCLSKGIPAPIISWRTKGEELQLLDDRPNLRFHADNRSLAGPYTCIANNGVGEPAMGKIVLRIKYKPEIEIKKPWVHASPGIRVQLDCKVSAYPEAKVEWYFNKEQVLSSSRIVKHYSGSEHSLVIRNVRQADFGNYLCRASNSLGITEALVELSGVANPAQFKKESRPVSKTAFCFIWQVDSYSPIIDYQLWFRQITRGTRDWHKLYIPGGSDVIGPLQVRSFNLTGLTEATNYEALLLSRNLFGWSRPSKIFRFATEGAPADIYEQPNKKTEVDGKVPVPVVQVASMSQHSFLVSQAPPREARIVLALTLGLITLHRAS